MSARVIQIADSIMGVWLPSPELFNVSWPKAARWQLACSRRPFSGSDGHSRAPEAAGPGSPRAFPAVVVRSAWGGAELVVVPAVQGGRRAGRCSLTVVWGASGGFGAVAGLSRSLDARVGKVARAVAAPLRTVLANLSRAAPLRRALFAAAQAWERRQRWSIRPGSARGLGR